MLNPQERDLLSARQIEQLYALSPVYIIASSVNGPILVYIQWEDIAHPILLCWLSALFVLNGILTLLYLRFRAQSRSVRDPDRWRSLFLWGTFASGCLWGTTGVIMFPDESIPHQIFVAFVLGVMIAGGTVIYASLEEAFLSFTFPAVIPLLVRCFMLGDDIHLAMGSMSLIFVALMLVTLRQNHIVSTASMKLSLEVMKSNQLLQQEIQDRTDAEMALRESREQLFSVMQSTDEGIISLNGQGEVILWNNGAERMFGFSADEMRGRTLEDIIPVRYRSTHQAVLKQAGRAGSTLPEGKMYRLMGLRKNGTEFPLELSVGFWRKGREIFFTGVVRDMTAWKQTEQFIQRREHELEKSQEELRALGVQLISAQEEEHRRLSRELHDDMSQRLAVVALHVQSMQKNLPESKPLQETLQFVNEQVSSLSDNIRHLAHQLHPSILDVLGLVKAVQSFTQDFSKWKNIPVTFHHRKVPTAMSQDIALCVYRVTQECLVNAGKHAQASHITVEMKGEKNILHVIIQDNGRGFQPDTYRQGQHGLGLIGMKERVRMVQGTFEVHASEGKGTTVTVHIPLPARSKSSS